MDDNSNSLILNNYYQYQTDTSGTIDILINDELFNNSNHTIYLESWDILNNHSIISYNINNINIPDQVFNVYNFPNPFNDKTFFTFNLKNPSDINMSIDIYSKNGNLIRSFNEYSNELKSYHMIPSNGWDGTDSNNKKVPNGTYLYKLKLTKENEIIYNKLHHLTKLN